MQRYFFIWMLMVILAACNPQAAPTPLPTATLPPLPSATPFVMPTLIPTQTALPVTPSSTPIIVEPFSGEGSPPPLTLSLPAGWNTHYDTVVYRDVSGIVEQPLALYFGPITGGSGTIVVLWNYIGVTTGNPFDPAYGQENLWIDGLRLLRLLIVEIGCNIGTDVQRGYTVGGLSAIGTQWSAVGCPEDMADTRGWFAGIDVNDTKTLFYMYADPITAMDTGKNELQAILDSVVFQAPAPVEVTAEATADVTPGN
jgi:hypothetical protein